MVQRRIALGRFRVVADLGSGSMGEVMLAEDTLLGRRVAIKRLRAELTEDRRHRERLRNEARIAVQFDHPAIVRMLDLLCEDGIDHNDLQARALGAFQKLALWLLRDARTPRHLLDDFGAWMETFAEAERAPAGTDAIATLLTYMFRVIDPMHHDELRAKIRQLGPHAEETAMTIAEQLHEEGRKEGLAKGRDKGRKEGLAKGRKEGLAKGRKEGRIAALRSLLVAKFGSQALDAKVEARLHAATPAAIDHYLQRVLIADSLAEVLED